LANKVLEVFGRRQRASEREARGFRLRRANRVLETVELGDRDLELRAALVRVGEKSRDAVASLLLPRRSER